MWNAVGGANELAYLNCSCLHDWANLNKELIDINYKTIKCIVRTAQQHFSHHSGFHFLGGNWWQYPGQRCEALGGSDYAGKGWQEVSGGSLNS